MVDTTMLVEYDPDWPRHFEAERQRLLEALAEGVRRIEHIGSTAVPGLRSKPIVDVLVVVGSTENPQTIDEALSSCGYRRIRRIGTRLFYGKGLEARPMCQLHIVAESESEYLDTLTFRDLLRHDTQARRDYQDLKEHLMRRFPNDVESYSRGKTRFILEKLDRVAKQE